ncbi:DEAD/DEAH box helicase [Ktedonobacter robiniae]|uniref:DEAD/DEAH box helicase n=1 Tax=Ktedonobacter robiniae TaxID=2778365 RepID=A0ABQ3UTM4_9CHLR|nr:DEAD/DEAH box helicase [Ktedonobacter robiniae]GHO56048.1 hypothetical protein KSB_45230 [Ktedonobacter robiniae]
MSGSQLSSPIVSAINIQKQYHHDVEAKLLAYGLESGISKTITTDIFAKDTIYFSRNRSYKPIDQTFDEFCKSHAFHTELPRTLSHLKTDGKTLYQHQAQAIESIIDGKTTIIATGTGSGKTESFLIPILNHCLVQKNHRQPGIKALILYPLNALANDQISRILKAVARQGIRVGCFIGSTPPTKQRTAEIQPELCISRQEMIDNPPDILITNYIMLDRLITKPDTYTMFRNSPNLKYLVVDEIHYFRGTKGANLSLLLRRLRALYQHTIVQIGASGTLRQSGGYFADSSETQIEQFARLIFGQEAIGTSGFQIVEPSFQEDEKRPLDPLPPTEKIAGPTLIDTRNREQANALCQQVFGAAAFKNYQQQHRGETGLRAFPGYDLIQASPFVDAIRKQLTHQAAPFSRLLNIFQKLFQAHYGYEPEDPKSVVEAYWSLIDYINEGCADAKLAPILDYRIHLILNDVSEELTRCLHCGHYHDGRCSRCRHCNGLLFKVSKQHPDQCIAYLTRNELYPKKIGGKQVFSVLVSMDIPTTNEAGSPVFLLEEHTSYADEEGYVLQPELDSLKKGITIDFNQNKQDLETLPISDAHIYWHNVFKIIDGLVTQQETRISDKLLGFIDNREKASGLKLRLNDDFAERALTKKASSIWQNEGPINLVEAFEALRDALKEDASEDSDHNERDKTVAELLQEMPFWFHRALTYIQDGQFNENPDWKISIDTNLELTSEESELLEKVMLQENAIDRSSFPHSTVLKHFHLDKYRVETQYGIGLRSVTEQGYHVTSLGERGVLYQEVIQRIGAATIEQMLHDLADRGIVQCRTTPNGYEYYQICPQYIYLETNEENRVSIDANAWKNEFALVECHTADHNEGRRADIERRFSDTQIQALICTPTLEMGVDIGSLSSVLMIGFPPSPANYAQRAGRAGRSEKSRRATIVVLSSSDDAHDTYYYAQPGKMIDGEITPPQFTLKNFSLLAAHSYAYLLAGTKQSFLATKIRNIQWDVQKFIADDELHLKETLGHESYRNFARYLYNDLDQKKQTVLQEKVTQHITLEYCYTHNIFPDYGFRNDGLPLYDKNEATSREDQDRFLTAREPEGAARKLAPGRIVFCGGRAVQVKEEQPLDSYHIKRDPNDNHFRLPHYVIANTEEPTQIEKWRDPNKAYRVSRMIEIAQPLEELEATGPLYSRVYLVPESTLYFINEGEIKPDQEKPQPLTDTNGEPYRFGTKIVRGGLLVRCSNSILSSTMKTSFLAVLLRSIPDYFDLDDTELRVIQNIQIAHAGQQNDHYADFFIYGQDKSGLVPFERIFARFNSFLQKALEKLKKCECHGSGCYLCLFSSNSSMLAGRISHTDAVNFLAAYMKEERLKPDLALKQNPIDHPDIVLHIKSRGNDWIFEMRDTHTNKQEEHRATKSHDSNTVLYQELRQLLQKQWIKGARSTQICSNQEYIRNQLSGEYNINKGKHAFFALWLERMRWRNWQVTSEEHDYA